MAPQLSVADVRLALHALRYSWYEDMTPDTPFLFSATALAESSAAEARRAEPVPEARRAEPTEARRAEPDPAPTPTPAAASESTTHLSMAEFGCVFDYAQHIKRHQRLVPRRDTGAGTGARVAAVPQPRKGAYAKPDQVLAEIKRKEELREKQEAEAGSALRASSGSAGSAGSASGSGSAL